MKTVLKLQQISRRLNEFFKQYSIWVSALLMALMFDTVSTIYFMNIIGIQQEAHPIVRIFALKFGPILGTFLSVFIYKSVVSLLLAAYLKKLRMFILLAPTITSTLAGFFNFLAD